MIKSSSININFKVTGDANIYYLSSMLSFNISTYYIINKCDLNCTNCNSAGVPNNVNLNANIIIA